MKDMLQGHILVVDDNVLNRMLMLRLLSNLGHRVTQAENGIEALNILLDKETEAIDVVLLDIMMPELDGYGLLEKVKNDSKLRSIPVIMTSALDELDSVVRCIEIGATDYLTKPVQPSLLKARLKSSLAEKRLRDLELEYLEQVGYVVSAAESVESETYNPESLRHVAMRNDALGRLARVFQKMADEVHLREQRLKQQLAQLQLDIEEMQKALAEKLEIYLPMDRRQALYLGTELPHRSSGAVLFADISDFTRLTHSLAMELGRTLGAEEITRLINQIFTALVEEVHCFKGSVISFSGDAITCWFDDSPVQEISAASTTSEAAGLRATACAIHMQMAIKQFSYLAAKSQNLVAPSIKVCVIAGEGHRHLVGDPGIQYLDILFGNAIQQLDDVEKLVSRDEILISENIAQQHREKIITSEIRRSASGNAFAVVQQINHVFAPDDWPEIPETALTEAQCKPWIHPAVYPHVVGHSRQYLSDLRPAAALFLQFQGIDMEADPEAHHLLDTYVKWLQKTLHDLGGAVLQISFGDKGSYMYGSFGAPMTHADDAVRAVRAALRILEKPAAFEKISGEKIGISYGTMRTGTYGGDARKTYGVIGNRTNLAARLMQTAESTTILCDQETYNATSAYFDFTAPVQISVKGREEKITVYRALNENSQDNVYRNLALETLDRYSPSEQMILKMASVIGRTFTRPLLQHLLPGPTKKEELDSELEIILGSGVIQMTEITDQYCFSQPALHEAIYQSMLHVQRRHLHRKIAATIEERFADHLEPHYAFLAEHWKAADDSARAMDYFDKAGKLAQAQGELEIAQQFFQESLALSTVR